MRFRRGDIPAAQHLNPTAGRQECRPSSRGFSLIEVLAALLLVSIVIPIVMQAFTTSTNAASMARHRAEAAALASSKLEELAATGEWSLGVLNGDFSPDHPDYTWNATVDGWDASTLQVPTVHVLWTSSSGQNDFSVSTFVDQGGTQQQQQ